MTDQTIRIATRKSPLAMWQAEYVAEELKKGSSRPPGGAAGDEYPGRCDSGYPFGQDRR